MRQTLGASGRPETGSLKPLLLASASLNVLALSLPIFILQVYDRVLPNHAITTLAALIGGLLVALVLDTALRALRAHLTTWNGARFEHQVRCRAVERLLRAPLQRFEADNAGVHLERVNSVSSLRDFYTNQVHLMLVDVPFGLMFLGLIIYLGGWLVMVPVTLLGLFALMALGVGKMLRQSVGERMEADKARYDFLIRLLQGIHTLKALALNTLLLRRQEALQEASARAVRKVMHQSTMAQTLGVLFAQINSVAIVAFGALSVLDGRMTMGALAACTLLAGRALQPLQGALGLWTSFQGVQVAQNQLDTLLALPEERPRQAGMPLINGAIEMNDVVFYPDADSVASGTPLFDGVSLSARPGEIIGIEGEGGSGKSSLLLLLMGMLTQQEGSIRIDGESIDDIDPAWLRRHIALLPQDGTIYAGTVIENLTSFREGEIVNEALYLAYLLGIDQTIKRMPEGYESRIGVGEVLPAGLRQRIAIIRELIKRPRIVLFDDADLALDADSSQRLATLLRQMARQATIIIVSAKPQFLSLATHRYLLRNGQLYPVSSTTGKPLVREVS
jgi:ATP-binding cassette subfamily C protein LapB